MKRLQQHAACSLIHPTSHTFHHTASSSDCTTARPLLLLYVLRTLSPTHTTFHCIADVIKNKEMRITTQSTILHYSLYWRCDAASFCLPTRSAVLRASTHSSQLSLSLSTRRSSPHLFPLALVFFTTLHAQPPSLFSHSSFLRCTCPPSHVRVFYSSFLSVARSASRTLLCCFVLFLALFPMKCESQAAVRCLKMLRRARPWASSASAVRITAPFAAKRAVIRRAIS